MVDLTRLSLVPETAAQIIQQPQTTIGSLEEQGASIRAPLALIKLSNDGLAKNLWELQTLCCAIVGHEEASGSAPDCD